mmetsp:Transcript_25624/g.86103  ORF Transcript_25624/g.86103 Transcript_25624/m.86103 type:complete len:288 (+) Transcript_25624:207-1070(+)
MGHVRRRRPPDVFPVVLRRRQRRHHRHTRGRPRHARRRHRGRLCGGRRGEDWGRAGGADCLHQNRRLAPRYDGDGRRPGARSDRGEEARLRRDQPLVRGSGDFMRRGPVRHARKRARARLGRHIFGLGREQRPSAVDGRRAGRHDFGDYRRRGVCKPEHVRGSLRHAETRNQRRRPRRFAARRRHVLLLLAGTGARRRLGRFSLCARRRGGKRARLYFAAAKIDARHVHVLPKRRRLRRVPPLGAPSRSGAVFRGFGAARHRVVGAQAFGRPRDGPGRRRLGRGLGF